MSSLVHYILFSFFCHICSEKFSFSQYIFLSIVRFSQGNTLFSLGPGNTISPFMVKNIFVCALCSSNLFFGFSICKKKKLFSFSFFAIVVEKKNSWFCKKKTFVSSWFTSLFAHSCLFCGRSADMDIGRGSSVAASRLISFLVSSFSCFQ